MITIFFSVRVHADRVDAFRAMAEKATPLSRGDDGCISYTFHQQKDDPRNFVLREQWRDEEALNAHIQHLVDEFGPPKPDGRLPASIIDMCGTFDVKFYDEIGS